MKEFLSSKGQTYNVVNLSEVSKDLRLELKKWSKESGQMNLPVIVSPNGQFVTNEEILSKFGGE